MIKQRQNATTSALGHGIEQNALLVQVQTYLCLFINATNTW